MTYKHPALLVLCLTLAAQGAAAVKICRTSAGVDVFADNGGVSAVSDAFATCIADMTVTAINLPPGRYLVDKPIIVNRSNFAIRTAGLAGNIKNCQQLGDASCALFIASSAPMACINNRGECHTVLLASGGGLLQARNAVKVVFDHLIIDGNREARRKTVTEGLCLNTTVDDHSKWGFNGEIKNCGGSTIGERCEFTYNYTRYALCGTALRWTGNFGRIQGNASFHNGVHTPLLWADGLTIHSNNDGIVNDNHLVNNSDVALIFGEAARTQIRSNWIQQNGMYAFAALMLGNFREAKGSNPPSGNYTGATVQFNTINCYANFCGFGINFGPDPFTDGDFVNVYGGTVTKNNINGARVLINFGGAGTSSASGPVVRENTLTGSPTIRMRLADGSMCMAEPNVKANLPKNGTTNRACDNWVDTDAAPLSTVCFKQCF